MNNASKFVVAVGGSLLAGFVGSFFTASSISNWYSLLEKPLLNPPNWIFAPVWTTLYILMGISVYLVWREGFSNKGVKKALELFLLQLILNVQWSIIFFGFQKPAWAFFEIIFLLVAILWTTFAFYKISRISAFLMTPYILWVSFASYLNIAIWFLNT